MENDGTRKKSKKKKKNVKTLLLDLCLISWFWIEENPSPLHKSPKSKDLRLTVQ